MTYDRWNYKIVEIKGRMSAAKQLSELEEVLNRHGNNGWELTGAPNHRPHQAVTLIFKKPR